MKSHYEQLLKDTICRLPKHDGETWWFVFTRDEPYARWCVDNLEEMDEEIREALSFLLDS